MPIQLRDSHDDPLDELVSSRQSLGIVIDYGLQHRRESRGVDIGLAPDGIGCFAGDLTPEERRLVWATHAAPAADLLNQKVEGTAWKSKPSSYILGSKDRTVHPELQRFVSKRMSAKAHETDSSHVPMLSQPLFVLDVIRDAVARLPSGR